MNNNGYIYKNNYYSYPNWDKGKRIIEEERFYNYEGTPYKTLEEAKLSNLKWDLYVRNPNNFPMPKPLEIYYNYLGKQYEVFFDAFGSNSLYEKEMANRMAAEEKATFLETKPKKR